MASPPASQPASQPAAIGQTTGHLTKCQPNPKSDPGGRAQWNHFWGFICLGSGWHFVSGQWASQLQLSSQPAIWQNVNLTLSQILVGCPSFTSIHKWHFVRWPASQLQLASQPAIWQNVNLTWSQIHWGGFNEITSGWVHLPRVRLAFCEMASQPASCDWPANQPYDKMVTWP